MFPDAISMRLEEVEMPESENACMSPIASFRRDLGNLPKQSLASRNDCIRPSKSTEPTEES